MDSLERLDSAPSRVGSDSGIIKCLLGGGSCNSSAPRQHQQRRKHWSSEIPCEFSARVSGAGRKARANANQVVSILATLQLTEAVAANNLAATATGAESSRVEWTGPTETLFRLMISGQPVLAVTQTAARLYEVCTCSQRPRTQYN